VLLLFFVFAGCFATPLAFADDWKPISQEELKMTSLPEAPGAPAVILYRQVDQIDKAFTESRQYNYVRMKILTEEGRKFGNITIPFEKGYGMISSIRARTVHADGSVVKFDGKTYETTLMKAKGFNTTVTAFVMPDVQAGSVLEYEYYRTLAEHSIDDGSSTSRFLLHDSEWPLNMELFTRFAKFSMNPFTGPGIRVKYSWPAGLPPGAKEPDEQSDGIIRMEARNIPAFEAEDYMPPRNEIMQTVQFVYHAGTLENNPDKFWKDFARKEYGRVEGFVGKPEFLKRVTSETIPLNEPSEANLRKLYGRVQQFRNLSYELRKNAEQVKQENLVKATNAEELWNAGYGVSRTLNWLFLGMARAAGFDVHALRVSNRKAYFFNKARMNARELGFSAVLVKLNGHDLILDPGAYLAAFGLLPWEETGVPALVLDKDGGTWLQTDLDGGGITRILRAGDLKLLDDGTLEGNVRVTFSGQAAFAHRIDQRVASDEDRKKALEEEVRNSIPLPSEVELTNAPDWASCAPVLVADFRLKIANWATAGRKRLLVPVGIFSAGEKQTFIHASRHYSVYFEYPYDHMDDLRISLPQGWQIASVPKASAVDLKAAKYAYTFRNSEGAAIVHRDLQIQFVLLEQQFYPTLRGLFQSLKSKDEEQIVLQQSD
jgi:hypothetical protein